MNLINRICVPIIATITALTCFLATAAGVARPEEHNDDTLLLDEKTAAATVAAFAQCDSSFFTLLGASPQLLGADVKIASRGAAAAPAVPDPLAEAGRLQIFSKAINASGLRLLAWRTEVTHDVSLGSFLFWGFDVQGSPDDVAGVVNRMVPPTQRLLKLGADWVRPEYRRIGDPIDQWRRGGQSGAVTEKGTVERVLLVEAHETSGRSKLYCTVQGSLSPTLLERIRPDLPPSMYP